MVSKPQARDACVKSNCYPKGVRHCAKSSVTRSKGTTATMAAFVAKSPGLI